MSLDHMDKSYDPKNVEKKWYDYWVKERFFHADENGKNKSFSIVIPPPNVTGVLHMGHALNDTMQDILCRYRRSRGDDVLWMPGTDHAGIATQNVVEKKLSQEGLGREDVGREKFIEMVWEWREKYGGAIINQLKSLGASCDWERERFTMDEGLSRAVRKVFVTLYNEGLIYKDNYIINWCCRCNTALADLEVEHEEKDGNLYHIRYPLADGSGELIVATTRPETMLGDTAVAVNPDDDRYKDISAAEVILPLMERKIPIIRDGYVDTEFGTGALKVTPAHDHNDFELGLKHNLDKIKVIGDDGVMTEEAGEFQGLDRFQCRKAVVKALEEKGFLVKIEPHVHKVGHCYRCRTVIEPNLSRQWFVKAKPLAEKAIEAVQTGKTKIIPESWAKTYYDWMNNIRDWCISRQIWWGHQIPAWTCESCGHMTVEMETPEACPKCGGTSLVQEEDVLDTWFSSALWPFSTMGWPDETPLLNKFYPTSVLVTAFDILFFWVARMMMMGIHFMGEVPFKDVYIHALVRDEKGKKMSKSVGNVIDPLNMIETFGTDAFRFTLAAFAAQGRDIKMSEKRVEGYRHFINKIWNSARFALTHLTKGYPRLNYEDLSIVDNWILMRLEAVIDEVAEALDGYRFNDAAGALYQFVWHEFCDWYLEAIKPVLHGKNGVDRKNGTLSALWHVLKNVLILLHPFIPFITEEIWDKLPGAGDSVMKARFPKDDPDAALDKTQMDLTAESKMNAVIDIITGIRNIRGEMNINPSMTLEATLQSDDESIRELAISQQNIIVNLARLKAFCVTPQGERPKSAATSVINGATIFISLEGIIDFDKEKQRLTKEIDKITKEMVGISKKLENEDFLSKAPDDVVEKVKGKHKALLEKQEKLTANLKKFNELSPGGR